MKKYVLGIDVGGTNIKLGIANQYGRVIYRSNLITKSFVRNKNKFLKALTLAIQSNIKQSRLKKKDLSGIGIGLPGAVDAKNGIVYYLTNVFGWKNVPLKKIIEKEIKIPTFIDNDVNVITLGEWKFGAGRGVNNMVCITLGTGVGGGLILDGVLYRGKGFAAGEVGHMPINEKGPRCNCGGCGCLECYVGRQYLVRRARKIFDKKIISLEEITHLASLGNKKAIGFWKEAAVHIGNGLTGTVNLLNPECIVIGGGIANAHKYMFKTIHKTIVSRAMKIQGKMIKVVKAKLGDDAGIIGAQVLVKNAITK